jgi:hypothetical protein
MKSVQDDLPEVFESNFSSDFGDVKNETYLISISEASRVFRRLLYVRRSYNEQHKEQVFS